MSRAAFDHELSQVEQALVQMHAAVDQALGQALRAFEGAYHRSAQALIRDDVQINERREQVEEEVLQLIARQQPILRDLRLCIAAIAIAADLERIADYAAGMAALTLRDVPALPNLANIHALATEARALLSDSIAAVVNHDAQAEARLLAADDSVDLQYAQLLEAFCVSIGSDEAAARHQLFTVFVAHNLERIADRAVNIAERAAWVATGKRRK